MINTKYVAIIATLLFCTSIASADDKNAGSNNKDIFEIQAFPQELHPSEPGFIRIRAKNESSTSKLDRIRVLSGTVKQPEGLNSTEVKAYPLSAYTWRDVDDRISEEWYIFEAPDIGHEAAVVFTIPGDAHKQVIAKIKKIDEATRPAYELLHEAGGFVLVYRAIENKEFRLTDLEKSKLKELIRKYPTTVLGDEVRFCLAADQFSELTKKHGWRGPDGAFRDCYDIFNQVINDTKTGILFVESLRRLAKAQVRSSDYDDARKAIHKIINDGSVSQYVKLARQGLDSDLKRYESARKERINRDRTP